MYQCSENQVGYLPNRNWGKANDNDPERKYLIHTFNFPHSAKYARELILGTNVKVNSLEDRAFGFSEWWSMEQEYRTHENPHMEDTSPHGDEFQKVHKARMDFEIRRSILEPEKKPLNIGEKVSLISAPAHAKVITAHKEVGAHITINLKTKKLGRFIFKENGKHIKALANSYLEYAMMSAANNSTKLGKFDIFTGRHGVVNTYAQMPARIIEVDGQDVEIPVHVVDGQNAPLPNVYDWSELSPLSAVLAAAKWDAWVAEFPEQSGLRQRARELYHQECQEISRRRALAETEKFQADAKAQRILFEHINEKQQQSWIDNKFFYAWINAKPWKFEYGTHGNVHLMDGSLEKTVERFCIAPASPFNGGQLPVDDVVLAQMLLIQADEEEFRRIANITYHDYGNLNVALAGGNIFQLMDRAARIAA